MSGQNGKGSRPRPLSISRQEYERRWEAIFTHPSGHGLKLTNVRQPVLTDYEEGLEPHEMPVLFRMWWEDEGQFLNVCSEMERALTGWLEGVKISHPGKVDLDDQTGMTQDERNWLG